MNIWFLVAVYLVLVAAVAAWWLLLFKRKEITYWRLVASGVPLLVTGWAFAQLV